MSNPARTTPADANQRALTTTSKLFKDLLEELTGRIEQLMSKIESLHDELQADKELIESDIAARDAQIERMDRQIEAMIKLNQEMRLEWEEIQAHVQR